MMKRIMILLICLCFFLSFSPVRAEGEEEDITYLTSTYYVITTGQERHLNVPYSDR